MNKFKKYINKLENSELKAFFNYLDVDEVSLLEFHFENFAKQLYLPVVVKSLKENEETAFDLWLKNFKEADGCYWFDKETLYVKQAMKDIYEEMVKHQL